MRFSLHGLNLTSNINFDTLSIIEDLGFGRAGLRAFGNRLVHRARFIRLC